MSGTYFDPLNGNLYSLPQSLSTGASPTFIAVTTNTLVANAQSYIDINSNLIPFTDSTKTLGISSKYWSNTYTDRLYLNSTAYLDGAVAGTANLTGNLGILATSGSATHSLTLGSTSTGIALYNTSDQTTNYERVLMQWNTNSFRILAGFGGTGAARDLQIGSQNRELKILGTSSSSGAYQFAGGSTSNAGAVGISATYLTSASSLIFFGTSLDYTIQQTGTAGYTALKINTTETTTGSGTKLLIDAQVGGVSKWKVQNDGVELPVQAVTASAPTYVKGGIYFDTTLNKLRVGGATAWETITSV